MTNLSVPNRIAGGGSHRLGGMPLPLVAVLVALALLAGCTGDSTGGRERPSPSERAEASPTPERVDLTGLPVERAAFCDILDVGSVEKSLGGTVRRTNHYGNGDEARILPGYVDVSHEYNCTFVAAGGSTASAWVFAPPVGRRQARRLVRRAVAPDTCTRAEGLRFGTPTVTSVCREREPRPRTRARMQGLFGDAWLSCEITVQPSRASRQDVLERAERWCIDVVTTLGARP